MWKSWSFLLKIGDGFNFRVNSFEYTYVNISCEDFKGKLFTIKASFAFGYVSFKPQLCEQSKIIDFVFNIYSIIILNIIR